MIATTHLSPRTTACAPEKATALALRLAHAENAVRVFTSGQVDAVIDADGRAYLLRPAQERLRQTEQHLRAILESSADVITVVNRGGEIVSQSSAGNRVLGCDGGMMVGKRFFEFVHTEDLAKVYAAYFNVIEGINEFAAVQFSHRDDDGCYRLIDASISRLRGTKLDCVVVNMRPAPSRPGNDAERSLPDPAFFR